MTHPLELTQHLQHLIGQPRDVAHRYLHRLVPQQRKRATLQVIAGLDHLDDSQREWFPQFQLSLRYDLSGCVDGISLNAQAHVWLAQQPLSTVARPDLLAYYRALQQPVLNLGGMLVSLSDGLSFCFYEKRLTWVYWSARQSSNGVA